MGIFKGAIIEVLKGILKAILGLVGDFIANVIKNLLLFRPPGEVAELRGVQQETQVVFGMILVVGWLVFFLNMQLFPEKSNSDPYRMLERSFAGIVIVVAGPALLNQAVIFTNRIGRYLFPSDLGSTVAKIAIESEVGSIVALAAANSFAGTFILAVIGFLIILSIRIFLIYAVYALLPLLAAFWIFDTGVGKYPKEAADMFFKAAGMILVSGVMVAALLKAGVAVSTADTNTACFPPMYIKEASVCLLQWNNLYAFIGLGGAMTISTTVAMLGMSSLMGGSAGSVAAGAVGGMAVSAMGKAKSAVGGGGGSLGPGGNEQAGADGAAPGGAGGGAGRQAQLEPVADGGGPRAQENPVGSGGSGAPAATLGSGTGGGSTSTVSTQRGGGEQTQPQEDQTLLDKTVAAMDAGSTVSGTVGKVDPVMGTAAGLAAGAYKFRQEGGFSDVKQATMDAGRTVSEKVDSMKHSYNSMTNSENRSEESTDESGLGDSNAQIDYSNGPTR